MASLCFGNIVKQLECIADVSGPKLLAWYEMLLYSCLMEALSKLHSSRDTAPANWGFKGRHLVHTTLGSFHLSRPDVLQKHQLSPFS